MYIDNVKFAKSGQKLSGTLDLAVIQRVQEIGEYSGIVEYTLAGSMDNLNRSILKLSIYGKITALCQNCLERMELTLDNQSQITIFYTEDQLDAALFADGESEVDDGIIAETEFDVMQLLEDEIIILLPYASKHESCIGLSYHDDEESPFSVLKHII
jgi:uncharacterized protein